MYMLVRVYVCSVCVHVWVSVCLCECVGVDVGVKVAHIVVHFIRTM